MTLTCNILVATMSTFQLCYRIFHMYLLIYILQNCFCHDNKILMILRLNFLVLTRAVNICTEISQLKYKKKKLGLSIKLVGHIQLNKTVAKRKNHHLNTHIGTFPYVL